MKKGDELGVRVYGIVAAAGCAERDDGPFGITKKYEEISLTELRGGRKNSLHVSLFCRRYGKPVPGCG